MYGWLWRSFPGGLPGKLLCSAVLLCAGLGLGVAITSITRMATSTGSVK